MSPLLFWTLTIPPPSRIPSTSSRECRGSMEDTSGALIGSAPGHLYFGVENYKNMNAVEYKHMASV